MEHGHTAAGAIRLRIVLCLLCLLSSSLAHRTALNSSMAREGEMGVQEASSMEAFVGRTKLHGHDSAAMAGNSSLLFVIGDSHGDKNYLVRCLLATGLFKLDQASKELVVWSPGIFAQTNFEVVVLGDFIDRGVFSRQSTMLLKALSDDETWGSHLVVLMGNHESMMLRYSMKYAQEEGWSADGRREDLAATEGSQHDLIVWMRKRPVVYLSQGVLMTHGGLSKTVSASVLKQLVGDECQSAGVRCGAAAMSFINAKASEFYEKVHRCIQGSRRRRARYCDQDVGRPDVIGSERDANLTVDWSRSGGGVLWFRGYSKVGAGAGTPASCNDVVAVGRQFGAHVMAVAHTTHAKITEYCHLPLQVPVFACDTHYTDCTRNGECDFDTQHYFHDGTINPDAENVPQTLKIEKSSDGSRKFSRCLSRVTESSEVFRSCYDVM